MIYVPSLSLDFWWGSGWIRCVSLWISLERDPGMDPLSVSPASILLAVEYDQAHRYDQRRDHSMLTIGPGAMYSLSTYTFYRTDVIEIHCL